MIAALLLPLAWLAGEIIGMQRQLREVGRLRLGVKNKAGEPRKLKTFRFTSADRTVIEAVAAVCGGEVKAWRNGEADQWEVITETAELPIVLPPASASQHYERWGKGYCLQRCDGRRDSVRRVACDCDPDNRKCQAVTRLSVIVPTIRGLGRWRLDSHGWWAGVEIPGAVALIDAVSAAGAMVRARLRLEQRRRRKIVNDKPVTLDYVVPVIDLDVSVEELAAVGGGAFQLGRDSSGLPAPTTDQLDAPREWQAIAPGPAQPAPPLEEQLAIAGPPAKKRANAATPVPATGAAVGGGTAERTCSRCGQPYGLGEVVRNPEASGSRFVHRTCPQNDAGPAPSNEGEADQSAVQGGGPAPDIVEPAEPTTGEPPEPSWEPGAEPKRPAKHGPTKGPGSLTYGQQGQIHRLVDELWPEPDLEGFDADARRMAKEEHGEYQRERLLALVAAVGGGELASRSDISYALAGPVIEALKAIQAGTWALEERSLVDTSTGEVIG
jgi:Recombination directionality factor-like